MGKELASVILEMNWSVMCWCVGGASLEKALDLDGLVWSRRR